MKAPPLFASGAVLHTMGKPDRPTGADRLTPSVQTEGFRSPVERPTTRAIGVAWPSEGMTGERWLLELGT